ncbi:ModD protein [Caminibacter sp.]
MYFTAEDIDRLINEDMSFFDLTKELLEIETPGKIDFFTRKDGVVSCNDLVELLAKRLNLEVTFKEKDGKFVSSGSKLFEAKGENVLILWKVAQNIYEYAMSVSTYVYEMKKIAKKHNPHIEILTTRKVIPFTKKIALKAVMDGGGWPHRVTTTETILVFENYINLYGGWEKFFKDFENLKKRAVEKKWVIECRDLEMAKKLVEIGVDVIQLDKVSPEIAKKVVNLAKPKNIKVLAAGGVKLENIAEYAKSGVDGVVTTAPYFAKGADIKVIISSL